MLQWEHFFVGVQCSIYQCLFTLAEVWFWFGWTSVYFKPPWARPFSWHDTCAFTRSAVRKSFCVFFITFSRSPLSLSFYFLYTADKQIWWFLKKKLKKNCSQWDQTHVISSLCASIFRADFSTIILQKESKTLKTKEGKHCYLRQWQMAISCLGRKECTRTKMAQSSPAEPSNNTSLL